MEGNADGGLTGANAVNAADTPRARSVPEDCLTPRAAPRSREGDLLNHFQSSLVTPRTARCCAPITGERVGATPPQLGAPLSWGPLITPSRCCAGVWLELSRQRALPPSPGNRAKGTVHLQGLPLSSEVTPG